MILLLQLLGYLQMRILELPWPMLGYQAHDTVELPQAVVHLDGQFGFIGREVEFLGLLKFPTLLEVLALLHVQRDNVTLGEVLPRYLQGLLPLTRTGVHLECVDRLVGFDEILLRKVILPHLLVMLRYGFVVGTSHFRSLHSQQLNSLRPLSTCDGSFYGFLILACFNEVVDSRLSLLRLHEVVGPALL